MSILFKIYLKNFDLKLNIRIKIAILKKKLIFRFIVYISIIILLFFLILIYIIFLNKVLELYNLYKILISINNIRDICIYLSKFRKINFVFIL